jgi:hypothetical protein
VLLKAMLQSGVEGGAIVNLIRKLSNFLKKKLEIKVEKIITEVRISLVRLLLRKGEYWKILQHLYTKK